MLEHTEIPWFVPYQVDQDLLDVSCSVDATTVAAVRVSFRELKEKVSAVFEAMREKSTFLLRTVLIESSCSSDVCVSTPPVLVYLCVCMREVLFKFRRCNFPP